MKNYDFQPEFIEAVEKKDISYLRSFIASTIRVDPAFNKAKCDDCMDYIKERGLDITEDFKLDAVEAPTPTNPSEWNKELFHKKVEYLRRNFAYTERVGELKKIGRVVYADQIKKEAPKQSFTEAPQGRRSSTPKTSPLTTSPLMIFVAVAAVVAVIVAIVLLFKK